MSEKNQNQIGRRAFLRGSAGSLLASGLGNFSPLLGLDQAAPWPQDRKVLFVCVDGLGPEYVQQSDMPNLKRMMQAGLYVEGASVIPSVTNVNNSSILTESFPADHGITGNYYYDRNSGEGTFMESEEFLLRPTIFDKAKSRGIKTGFVTSKEKLMFLSRSADLAVSAERPTQELLDRIGPQQDVYSPDINFWSFRTARHFLNEGECQLVYLVTTDYMMHTYAPSDERSLAHLNTLDDFLGQILNDHSDLEVYLTADHGMSAKRTAIDIGFLLASNAIEAEVVPIIRDRYVVHHQNLGGAGYVYLENASDLEEAFALLGETSGVEEIYGTREAAAEFNLHPDRIGDIFILGEQDVVFGDLGGMTRDEVDIRSHGSRHESTVPIICYGRNVDASLYQRSIDLTRNFSWDE
jgi:phosphonoacetate hydrolase